MSAQVLATIALWIIVPIAAWEAVMNLSRVHQLRHDLDEWGEWMENQVSGLHWRFEKQLSVAPEPEPPTVTVQMHEDAPDPDPATVPTPIEPPATVPESEAITNAGDRWVEQEMAKIMAKIESKQK